MLLLVTAIFRNSWHRHRLLSLRLERLKASSFTSPVSLIVPAHNEEMFIVASVRALLSLDYPSLGVVVVNDGSCDRTLAELERAFQLRPTRLLYIPEIVTAPVHAIYKSSIEPRLLVLDKESAGSKADAVNAGLNAATSPYVCVVDADSILEKDSLLRIMAGVFRSPTRDGCGRHRACAQRMPSGERRIAPSTLAAAWYRDHSSDRVPRAFLIGREGWAQFNALPIISGAFGVFRTNLVREIKGYRSHAIGEDFDLVVRLHRHLQEQGREYEIDFIPDPTCWTEVPSDLRSLARQRARWHKGLLDTLWPNRDLLFRCRYGRVGSLILPYMWVFEFFAPVIELVRYSTIILAASAGMLSRQFFLLFLLYGYAFATLISIGSVLLEEMTYRRYSSWREVARLLLYCLFEHFPYRQMTLIWRLQGIWQYLRGDYTWREMKRARVSAAQ